MAPVNVVKLGARLTGGRPVAILAGGIGRLPGGRLVGRLGRLPPGILGIMPGPGAGMPANIVMFSIIDLGNI